MNNKSIIKIIAASVSAYILCYAVIRLEGNMIVHYMSTGRCEYVYHSVDAGDTGFLGRLIYAVVAVTFTPLRLLEEQYWNTFQPPGSTIWKEDRNRFESCENRV
ncbi:hypothetical protein [Rivularia sp. PCC 7116]|uniref:hypothetical protein n=1 Tax=Rivularia sp. PCC 7116 TaxID=373994 RepID=UPI0005C7C7A4|nr:hypothetical protein [Rivularia sp. PCC 7116]